MAGGVTAWPMPREAGVGPWCCRTSARPPGSRATCRERSAPATSSRCPAISAPARRPSRAPCIRAHRGRPRARGAEPDLHPAADLRRRAVPGGPRRSLPRRAARRARRARLGGGRRRRPRAGGMARPRRRDCSPPTASTITLDARARPRPRARAAPGSPALARLRAAAGAHARGRGSSSTAPAGARPSVARCAGDASTPRLRAAGRARPPRHADGRAAPGRTARRCGTASPTARIAHLAETVTPFVAMAHALARARPVGARDLRRRLRRSGSCSSRISATERGRRRSAGADPRALPDAPPSCWPRCMRRTLPDRAAGGAARSTTRCRAYDLDALLIEVELLLDWYLPYRTAWRCRAGARGDFVLLWREALAAAASGPQNLDAARSTIRPT